MVFKRWYILPIAVVVLVVVNQFLGSDNPAPSNSPEIEAVKFDHVVPGDDSTVQIENEKPALVQIENEKPVVATELDDLQVERNNLIAAGAEIRKSSTHSIRTLSLVPVAGSSLVESDPVNTEAN